MIYRLSLFESLRNYLLMPLTLILDLGRLLLGLLLPPRSIARRDDQLLRNRRRRVRCSSHAVPHGDLVLDAHYLLSNAPSNNICSL
jgi:hypothetical protein